MCRVRDAGGGAALHRTDRAGRDRASFAGHGVAAVDRAGHDSRRDGGRDSPGAVEDASGPVPDGGAVRGSVERALSRDRGCAAGNPRRGASRPAPMAAAVAAVLVRERGAPRASTEGGLDPRRIAVLYFEDLSPKRDLAYLADGLTEALIDALGRVPSLSVLSKNATAAYRTLSIPRDSVARALAAGTLVQGSVEETGTHYQVTVRLIDGASGADFKRASFEQPAASALAVRDSLASRVAEFLRERLGEEVRLRQVRAGTLSVAAWSLFQRAERARKNAGALIEADSLAAAKSAFRLADSLAAEAQRLDAQWAEPVALRAAVAYHQARVDFNAGHASPWIDKGLAFAAEALKIDPRNPDALEVRGTLHFLQYLLRLAPTPSAA